MRRIFLALIFLFCACGDTLGTRSHRVLNDDKEIVTTIFPQEKRLQNSLHKPTIWFFFTENCGVCKEAIPHLNALAKVYEGEIEVLGVLGRGMGEAKDRAFLERYEIGFKVISERNSAEYLSRAFGGVRGVPALFMLDELGRIKRQYFGLVPRAMLDEGARVLRQGG